MDSALVWAHDQIVGDKTTRLGDVLVKRATGTDGYDQYICNGQYYDFAKDCGTGPSYMVSVDGSTQSIYELANVYAVAASNGTCL